MTDLPPQPHKRTRARGTDRNPETRFDAHVREAVDDGWTPDEPALARTEVSVERPRSIIARNTSPDISFDRSINPYRGCEHGCIYCFARPSHGYLGMSPGLDFETKLIARPDAAAVLERQLRARSYRPATIAIGTNTDPYQPIEREWRVMRQVLEVLERFRHPVAIATKGVMIERDADILARMSGQGLARAGISITTLDAELARTMEPRVPSPKRRLQAIERLAKAGVEVRVMVSPVVPGLTDTEIDAILAAARDAGAVAASWIMLRLPFEVAGLFEDWLERHAPNKRDKVLARVREMHGGALYSADWGHRMRGEGLFAELTAKRFEMAVRRLGLKTDLPPLRSDLFAVPLGDADQPSLFD
ncbi:Cyclic pyranopterin monophosphate synthase [Rhodobacteraceae bacterium THAF1]|uniref:PA0069 family radical SAM protein n=1 Tax=Palleronia sp. THAF1 TaxID=2587842 RepID=UPI000F41101C|nr:PA0069 family radical SAM protein [Palleronia sp. THAF1]QFU08923.1 Cyclic pyranopterin monophosphate synthase [Palleronia sp. THAF1]VDC24360.1 Cyclic pyranopterin monophosphate synthase [Rhodobacteraceae bacterium THAF1]